MWEHFFCCCFFFSAGDGAENQNVDTHISHLSNNPQYNYNNQHTAKKIKTNNINTQINDEQTKLQQNRLKTGYYKHNVSFPGTLMLNHNICNSSNLHTKQNEQKCNKRRRLDKTNESPLLKRNKRVNKLCAPYLYHIYDFIQTPCVAHRCQWRKLNKNQSLLMSMFFSITHTNLCITIHTALTETGIDYHNSYDDFNPHLLFFSVWTILTILNETNEHKQHNKHTINLNNDDQTISSFPHAHSVQTQLRLHTNAQTQTQIQPHIIV